MQAGGVLLIPRSKSGGGKMLLSRETSGVIGANGHNFFQGDGSEDIEEMVKMV